jgi:nitrite reductase (NADH) large subunit
VVKKADLVVIGNGMVGHKVLDLISSGDRRRDFNLTTFVEEPRLAYDRVNLTSYFDGKTADDLAMASRERYAQAGITAHVGDKAVAIDRAARTVTSAAGRVVPYDKLILATGSIPFVPAIAGNDAAGCFVYRTLEDLTAIERFAAGGNGNVKIGAVIGGGLLGLEAANALRQLGLTVHVVEFAPRLMALQLDEAGGFILRRRIEALGVQVHTSKSTTTIGTDAATGKVSHMTFADGSTLDTDMVVFSAGIRPRDELGRQAGLAVGPRGGITIDERCRTSDPDIYAVGECALFEGRTYGLVAPGYQMARAAVADLTEGHETFTGFDMSTKLKLLGVDVASFGDGLATTPGARVISLLDGTGDVYKKLVLDAGGKKLLGGILVGDAGRYAQLSQMVQNEMTLPPHPEDLILPAGRGGAGSPAGFGIDALPDAATICSCHNVDKKTICDAITGDKLTAVSAIKACTKAGTGCGSCVTLLSDLLKSSLKRAGVAVTNYLCEHFSYSRQQLYDLVRVHKLHTFEELVAKHGHGRGCEICKPAVASILASAWNEHILQKRHLPLQDTNDRFMANIQRDGTYSVVPRVPAGEITPDQLILLGQVAKTYGLYTKITGGQRVDLFGARLEQLPDIWRDLIAGGFESGHAYGKALRTVKSCVGSTWCRYGVQDSVGLALKVEHRYKGLRSPHKLKSAVSGCARECAEAQGKDFGIIATEKGYNLYLCGNGGMKPQHAQLFAVDLDEETVFKYVDRFLMFYIRTADRLQRTATWFNNLEGGMDYLRQVLIEDSLGICAELEAEMAHIVGTYQCEWKTAVNDPDTLKLFHPFVNAPVADPSIVFVPERAQHRPASWDEKAALLTRMAGGA